MAVQFRSPAPGIRQKKALTRVLKYASMEQPLEKGVFIMEIYIEKEDPYLGTKRLFVISIVVLFVLTI